MPFFMLPALMGVGAAGGTAAVAAGAGAGAGIGLGTGLMAAGAGLSLAQSFGGGGQQTGYAPSEEIKLSPEGEKLEKALFGVIKTQYQTGLMPENLASVYIGKIKRAVAPSARIPRGVLAGGKVRTGRQMGQVLGEAGERVEGEVAPTKWKTEQRREEMRNAITNLMNIMNIERQVPLLKAQSQMAQTGISQYQRAIQGQALGGAAQMGAMLMYPPYAQ